MRATKKITTRVGLTLGTVLVALVLLATPASAHSTTAYHGNDMSEVGCLGQTGWRCIRVWDRERDGHGVYAQYQLRNGNVGGVADPDGSGSGSGLKEVSSDIVRHRVCERGVGCSAWKNV